MKHFLILLYTLSVIAIGIWLITAMTIDTFAFDNPRAHIFQEDTLKLQKPIKKDKIEKDTSIYYANMLTPSEITEEELAQALKYDLIDLAGVFLEAEEEYGVNAVHLAAIAALESGWGRYQFEENNIFGFFTETEFKSEEECIMYVAGFLAEHYLSKDGMYYGGGYRLKHINKRWNGSEHWLTEVKGITSDIIDRIEDYRKEA